MHFAVQPAILRDFDKFLDYLGQSAKIELTKDKGSLRTTDLHRLNDAMHFRLEVFNPKSQQTAFSLLNTFFHIARTAQMFFVKKDALARTCWLSINPARIREYDTMNNDEQYFFLLEAFWSFVNWDAAYDCRVFSDTPFYMELLKHSVGKPVTIGDQELKRTGQINGPMYTFSAEMLQAFGFFNLVWDEKLDKRPNRYSFPYQSATLTPFGKTALPILLKERPQDVWGERDPFLTPEIAQRLKKFYEEAAAKEYFFQPDFRKILFSEVNARKIEDPNETTFDSIFRPIFPNLEVEKRLYPIVQPFIAGRYEIRVSLSAKCYREIAISGEKTLEDLHSVIQNLFDFDDDHLYAFHLSGKKTYRDGQVYTDTRGGVRAEQKPADLFKIGELGFFPGKEVLYIFDFGDNWQFLLMVLAVEPGSKVAGKYELLKTVGKPPRQYASWGDEED